MTGPNLSISLIGLRGSGKSTLARALSKHWGLPWIDADEILQKEVGMSIADIFRVYGQDWFRDKESEILQQGFSFHPWILATGGGVILRPQNRAWLRNQTLVVWLDAPSEVLAQRIFHDSRSGDLRPPLVVDPGSKREQAPQERTLEDWTREMEALRSQRAPLYQETAHIRLDTSMGTVEDWVKVLETQITPKAETEPDQGEAGPWK